METNWIRFDPDDKLTWPEMETDYWSKAVLVCDTDHHIYIGVMRISDSRNETEWFLTNDVEDVSVPADCVTAWMPLPEPYITQESLPADDQGEWLIDDTGYTCTCSVCGAKCIRPIMPVSDAEKLPEQCPKCKSRMKRYSRGTE